MMVTLNDLEEFQELVQRFSAGAVVSVALMELTKELRRTNNALSEIDKTAMAISRHVDHIAQILDKK